MKNISTKQQDMYSERLLDTEFDMPAAALRRPVPEAQETSKDHPFTESKCQQSFKRPALAGAAFFVLLAVATWISEIELTRYILNSKGNQGGYNNPYAMMWMSHNLYIPFGYGMSIILKFFAKDKNTHRDSASHGSGNKWEAAVSHRPSFFFPSRE